MLKDLGTHVEYATNLGLLYSKVVRVKQMNEKLIDILLDAKVLTDSRDVLNSPKFEGYFLFQGFELDVFFVINKKEEALLMVYTANNNYNLTRKVIHEVCCEWLDNVCTIKDLAYYDLIELVKKDEKGEDE